MSKTSIDPNGSSCTAACECNNQTYFGACVEGKCKTYKREECQTAGFEATCRIQAELVQGGCREGIKICKPEGLDAMLWGACKPNCEESCKPGDKQPCYTGDEKTQGKGICKPGERFCGTGGTWEACKGEVIPKAEECNGQDDDCDGQADETLEQPCYTGAVETRGKGICKDGTQRCVDGKWESCAREARPQNELCNGEDDDCDGNVDNQPGGSALTRECYGGRPGSEGKGVCKKGTQVCNNGTWGACGGDVTPQTETCNGQDDDCDGNVDNAPDKTSALSRECYTGPAGSEGKGTCKKGAQVCNNGTWAPCTGDVKPQVELCNKRDDDCDGSVDEDFPKGCCAKDQDCNSGFSCRNALCVRTCTQDATCPDTEYCKQGLCDPCPDGGKRSGQELCWDDKDNDCDGKLEQGCSSFLQGFPESMTNVVATDAKGSTYFTGSYRGTLSLGSSFRQFSQGFSPFVAKQDRYNNLVWAFVMEPSIRFHGLAPDANDHLHLLGTFSNTVKVGTIQLTNTTGKSLSFVAKYNATKTFAWATPMPEAVQLKRLRLDGQGRLYAWGVFTGTVKLGTYTLTSKGAEDICLIRFDATGKVSWATSFGGTGSDVAGDFGFDTAGQLWVFGTYAAGITIGTQSSSGTNAGLYLAQLNANTGAPNWLRAINTTSTLADFRLAFASGHTYLGATYTNTLTFVRVSHTITSRGGNDAMLAKYDTAGQIQWLRSYGDTGNDTAAGVDVNSKGEVFFGINFEGQLTISSNTFKVGQTGDALLLKFDANAKYLSALYTTTTATSGLQRRPYTRLLDLAVGPLGFPRMVGFFKGRSKIDFSDGLSTTAGGTERYSFGFLWKSTKR